MRVVVLSARGLRPDYLGCYGNPWVETPSLDALAAGGVVLDGHFADAADAAGARHAWRTGRYILPDAGGAASDPGGPDLLAALAGRGVAARLLLDGSRPAPDGFEAGWGAVERVSAGGDGTPLEQTVDAARAAIRRMPRRGDWLLWADLATVLPPWDVPADFREHYFQDEPDDEEGDDEEGIALEPLTPLVDPDVGAVDPEDDTLFLRLQGSYAAAITYLDAGIGQMLEAVRTLDGGDEVVVLVTADVGFPLGEHGVVGPARAWPHNELVQLPLIARLPGGDEAGRRVAALTQAVDLAPTLADVFDVPFGPVHGRTLVPLMQGEAEAVRAYAVSGLRVGDEVCWALRTPTRAFLLPVLTSGDEAARPRLYVRPDDRAEVNDVLQHHPEWAGAAERTLREFAAATRRPGMLEAPTLSDGEVTGSAEAGANAGKSG